MNVKILTLAVIAFVLYWMRPVKEGACPLAKGMNDLDFKARCDALGGVVKETPKGLVCECPDGSEAV